MNNINYKEKILDLTLIIGGIQIALWINNWNQNRIDRKQETVILHQLKSEFDANLIEIDPKISTAGFSWDLLGRAKAS